MKILFVAPKGDLTGGATISYLELILHAKKIGHSPHVVLPAHDEFAKKLTAKGIAHSIISFRWWGTFFKEADASADLNAVAAMADLAKTGSFDCIVTNSLNFPWAALAAAASDTPHVWMATEMPLYQFSYLDDHYDFIKNYSNVVLANSKTNAKFVESKIGVPVDNFFHYVDETKLELRGKIAKPRLVNVGNIQSGKNQLDLIKAAGLLKKKGKLSADILLIGTTGDQPYLEKITQTIERYNLAGNVKMLGFQADPYEFIGPNDIFVQTSAYDSFGMVTVEALKLGLVCVGADIDATKEIFSYTGGTLYKVGDAADLAEKLEKVLENPVKYQQEAQIIQAAAIKKFSKEGCHEPFFKALAKAASQPNPRREFRHIAPPLEAIDGQVQSYKQKAEEFQRKAHIYRTELDNIINSRAWKLALLARKVLRR